MKLNIMFIGLFIFCIACGGANSRVRSGVATTPTTGTLPTSDIITEYNRETDTTTSITKPVRLRYRTMPHEIDIRRGSSLAGFRVVLGVTYRGRAHVLSADEVVVLTFPTLLEVPKTLLLINISNGRWIKTETVYENGMYMTTVPLTTMEEFLNMSNTGVRNGIVGYLGSRERFVQFAIDNRVCDLFQRFLLTLR